MNDTTDDTHAPRKLTGVGLALSGGGYKAATFHLGGLCRLNELGQLPRLNRIASVSGGSITASFLAANWHLLDFGDPAPKPGETRVATNFKAVIADPLRDVLTQHSVHGAGEFMALSQFTLKAALPFMSNPADLAAFYRKHLFKDQSLTLKDLPDPNGAVAAPEFVILATDLRLNSLWRFSRGKARNRRIGAIDGAAFPLEKMVAASSGFPPFLCPIYQDFDGLRPQGGASKLPEAYYKQAVLCDGGIFDNMGLEPIWSDFDAVMISNAGDSFEETEKPNLFWLILTRRILSMVHRQAENNRIRWMYDRVGKPGQPSRLIHWPLRELATPYPDPGPCTMPADAIDGAVNQKVMLTALKPHEFSNLANHGYVRADAATRSYLGLPEYCASTPPF